MNPRILFVSSMRGPAWGGSEELWSQTAAHLARQSFHVSAELPDVSHRPAHPKIHGLQSAGVQIGWWPASSARKICFELIYDRLHARLKLPARDSAAWFRKRIRRQRPQLAVFSSGHNAFPADLLAVCKSEKIRYALLANAVHEYVWPNDEMAAEMRAYFHDAAAAYFVSQANLFSTRLQTGLTGENFQVVRNPCNVPWSVQIPWPETGDILKLAVVGRLEPGTKGCDLILQVLARDEWRARKVEVHFFGTGNSAEGVQRMAQLLNVPGCFFHGHVSDIVDLWRQHHALVLPSRYEGLPISIVEAMFCGRPCVVTDVSGNAELLQHGVTGFVADGSTVHCLAKAMEDMWKSRKSLPEMGRAAALSIRRQVPENVIEVFASQLTQLCAGL